MRLKWTYEILSVGGLGFLISLAFTGEAHAYIDPGTGSLMLQALIGGLAGGLFMIKIYWRKLKEMFAGGKQGTDQPDEGQDKD